MVADKQIECFHSEQGFDIILTFTNIVMEISWLFLGVNVMAWILWGKPSTQPQLGRITFCGLLHMSVPTFWAFHQLAVGELTEHFSTSSENWSLLVRDTEKNSPRNVCFSPTVISLDWTAAAILRFPLLGSTKIRILISALCHALQALPQKAPRWACRAVGSPQHSHEPTLSKPNTPQLLGAHAAWTKGHSSEEQVYLQWLQPNSTSTYPHSTKVPHFLDQIIWILLVFLFSQHWWHRSSLSQSCFGGKRRSEIIKSNH